MPTYTFRNKATGDVAEVTMPMAALDTFKANHPEVELVILATPPIVSGVGGIKTTDGFNDLLKRIKSKHRKSTIQTR